MSGGADRDGDPRCGGESDSSERAGTEALLTRVRSRLAEALRGAAEPPPDHDPEILRRVAPGGDLPARFEDAASRLGMQVSRIRGEHLAGHLEEILGELGARSAAASLAPGPLADAVAAAAHARRCTLVDWQRVDGLEAHYEVDCGISDVIAAVAETGSLVVASGGDRSRAAHLVPPCHVALVEQSRIVPDLVDLWEPLGAGPDGLPASVTLVSGPSKTADIEGILITGVHGPGTVRVVVIEQAGD